MSKKPYNAAGMTESGVRVIISDEERKRQGIAGKYPFSTKLKNKMVKEANGVGAVGDIVAVIDRLAGKPLVV